MNFSIDLKDLSTFLQHFQKINNGKKLMLLLISFFKFCKLIKGE